MTFSSGAMERCSFVFVARLDISPVVEQQREHGCIAELCRQMHGPRTLLLTHRFNICTEVDQDLRNFRSSLRYRYMQRRAEAEVGVINLRTAREGRFDGCLVMSPDGVMQLAGGGSRSGADQDKADRQNDQTGDRCRRAPLSRNGLPESLVMADPPDALLFVSNRQPSHLASQLDPKATLDRGLLCKHL